MTKILVSCLGTTMYDELKMEDDKNESSKSLEEYKFKLVDNYLLRRDECNKENDKIEKIYLFGTKNSFNKNKSLYIEEVVKGLMGTKKIKNIQYRENNKENAKIIINYRKEKRKLKLYFITVEDNNDDNILNVCASLIKKISSLDSSDYNIVLNASTGFRNIIMAFFILSKYLEDSDYKVSNIYYTNVDRVNGKAKLLDLKLCNNKEFNVYELDKLTYLLNLFTKNLKWNDLVDFSIQDNTIKDFLNNLKEFSNELDTVNADKILKLIEKIYKQSREIKNNNNKDIYVLLTPFCKRIKDEFTGVYNVLKKANEPISNDKITFYNAQEEVIKLLIEKNRYQLAVTFTDEIFRIFIDKVVLKNENDESKNLYDRTQPILADNIRKIEVYDDKRKWKEKGVNNIEETLLNKIKEFERKRLEKKIEKSGKKTKEIEGLKNHEKMIDKKITISACINYFYNVRNNYNHSGREQEEIEDDKIMIVKMFKIMRIIYEEEEKKNG